MLGDETTLATRLGGGGSAIAPGSGDPSTRMKIATSSRAGGARDRAQGREAPPRLVPVGDVI